MQITTEDLELICFVMGTLKGVQEKAIFHLKNLTLSPSNVPVLEMKPSVAALIQKARSAFPYSFGGRADYYREDCLLQVLAPHTQYY